MEPTMQGDRPQGVRVEFDGGRPPLPLDLRWEGFDEDGFSLWVATCSPGVLRALHQGVAHLCLDVLPGGTTVRLGTADQVGEAPDAR